MYVSTIVRVNFSSFSVRGQYFDSDRNGYIDAKELGRVMLSLGEQLSENELNEMISAGDRDGDGRVSFPGAPFA